MKNLIVGSLIALAASQAAGCIITSGDDTEEDAFISASWDIRHLAPDMNIPCPPGFDTAALISKSVNGAACDPLDPNGSDTCIELFDCGAGAGTSAPLIPNVYQSWIQIQDHNGGQVFAKSLSATVDVVDQDRSFDAQILENGGYFQLSWDLKDKATNQPLSCTDAASTGVESIASVISDPNNAKSDIYDCDAPYGISAGLITADYTVSVHALGANDAQIGDSVVVNRATIGSKNAVTDLGTFMLPID